MNFKKRIIRTSIESRIGFHSETSEGMLYDVLDAQRLCRVRVQGSEKNLVAHYPQNWGKRPPWLKPGDSVRILHSGGLRGRLEVIGHGEYIPTGVAVVPTIPPDAVLTGCGVTECFNNPRMAVLINKGTFRINNVSYSLNEITMNSDVFAMNDGGAMDMIAGAVAINTAPSIPNFRYDLISVGTDLAIDYTAGTPAIVPVKPSVAANHLALAYILVPGGVTSIRNSNINQDWAAPIPVALTMLIADEHLAWGEMSTDITLTVLDQYSRPLTSSGVFYFSLEITSGNGQVWSSDSGYSTSIVYQSSSYQGIFKYYRDGLGTDVTPSLEAKVYLNPDLSSTKFIFLYDSGGGIMM